MMQIVDSKTCLNLFKCNMIPIVTINTILKHVWTCWNMSTLVQIQYDMNWYNSCDSQNMSEHVETCLNLFRFNMIWIVMIHMILKHVWTCWNKHVLTCSNSIWYELLRFIWFSNVSEHVQTCLNLYRFNMIWIVTIHKILKHV